MWSGRKVVMCQQAWWKLCWINSDHEKFLRKIYARNPSLPPLRKVEKEQDEEDEEEEEAADVHVNSDEDSGCDLDEYTWVPPGLNPQQVREYFAALPDEKVPFVNSPGERYRLQQLFHQLPPHDIQARYCHQLSEAETRELELFSLHRMKEYLGRGVVKEVTSSVYCHRCKGRMWSGELCVVASRAKAGSSWHPACFSCVVCQEQLVDLIYFYVNDEIYCGRHQAEIDKARCTSCDEIIFADECTEAEGRVWHVKHFVCVECNTQLGGQHYIMKDSKPLCLSCLDSTFTDICQSCKEPIKFNQGQMSYEKEHWHATEKCFSCNACGSSLLGFPFIPRRGLIFCSVLCCKEESIGYPEVPFIRTKPTIIEEVEEPPKIDNHCRSVKVSKVCASGSRVMNNTQPKSGTRQNKYSSVDSQEGVKPAIGVPFNFREIENEEKKTFSDPLVFTQEITKNSKEFNNVVDSTFYNHTLMEPHLAVTERDSSNVFQRSILKKYSESAQGYDINSDLLPERDKSSDLGVGRSNIDLQYKLQTYFSQEKEEISSSFEYMGQSFRKKRLRVRFQCIIPEIKYADTVSGNPENPEKDYDSVSTCSTCSSSSSEDVNAYKLTPRREYGGIRISYIPNDALARVKMQQSIVKRRNEKQCVIS